MDFQIDPVELHQFPDRPLRRELQHPANLRELIEDLDSELAARLDFDGRDSGSASIFWDCRVKARLLQLVSGWSAAGRRRRKS
jgi:hypothetical protein